MRRQHAVAGRGEVASGASAPLRSDIQGCCGEESRRETKKTAPSPGVEVGYQATPWSKSKSGSGWPRGSQSGIGSGASSQARGSRVGRLPTSTLAEVAFAMSALGCTTASVVCGADVGSGSVPAATADLARRPHRDPKLTSTVSRRSAATCRHRPMHFSRRVDAGGRHRRDSNLLVVPRQSRHAE